MKSKIVLIILLISLALSGCGSTGKSSGSSKSSSHNSNSSSSFSDEKDSDDESYGTDFESTWGDLIEANDGDLVYDTLTSSQRALVHFPKYDPDCVYYVPDGKSYHSVDWCYTLSRSTDIRSTTELDAEDVKGLEPCSKCVP